MEGIVRRGVGWGGGDSEERGGGDSEERGGVGWRGQ